LNITYSKKKQEMRHDPIMESLLDVKNWLAKNNTVLASVALALVFILVVGAVYMTIRRSSIEKAQEGFGKAMSAYVRGDEAKAVELFTNVADNNKSTPQAAYSAYIIGSIYLNQDKYDEAIEWLSQVANRNDAGFVPGEALEALGTAYEGKGDIDNAKKYYDKALADNRAAYRHPAIRWKIALLDNQLKQFDNAKNQCRKILSDTLAVEFHSRAQQLMAEIRYSDKS
jgi:tetratricopeptide (TPR) repeat protein